MFGCQAPDTGNAEIIAHYGTDEQKEQWLQPLLNGEVFSCYSMTEPQGGSDPTMFTAAAVRDGDEWVINGEKFFSSNLREASFLIVMAVTNTEVSAYRGMSMFLVPSDTPGIEVLANIGLGAEAWGEGMHAHVRYDERAGAGREPARRRGPGLRGGPAPARRRSHPPRHAGGRRRAEAARHDVRAGAVSRTTQGELLAKKQMVQEMVADSWIQLQSFRLMVLHTAWLIDQSSTARGPPPDRGLQGAGRRGARATSASVPSTSTARSACPTSWASAPAVGVMMGIMDGPTEVHKISVARQVLKGYEPSADLWPTEFGPAAARRTPGGASTRWSTPSTRPPTSGPRFDELLQRSAGDDETVKQMQAYLDATIGNL